MNIQSSWGLEYRLALDTIIRLGRSWNAVNSSDMIVESILASEDFRAVCTIIGNVAARFGMLLQGFRIIK